MTVPEILGRDLSTEARARVLGRELVFRAGDHQKVLELGVEIGKLTAGIDPDTVDTESPDYKAGVEEAYSAICNALLEMEPFDKVSNRETSSEAPSQE